MRLRRVGLRVGVAEDEQGHELDLVRVVRERIAC